jgi:hygromycin-B 4-O-kinase
MAKAAGPSGARLKNGAAIVRRIIAHHFGSKPRRIDRQTGGLSNLVFAVEHDAGELIVRLNPHQAKLNPFLKEQWAAARAREAGVPVAEILEVGNDPLPYDSAQIPRPTRHFSPRSLAYP